MRRGFFILFFIAHSTFAQFKYGIDQTIPVTLENGNALSMPWAGGLNATHFNTIDLNNDGLEDLAIFDKTANRVITFIRDNTHYRYAPEYETLFPSDIISWMQLRDFNGDGKKDIFTNFNNDIKVYLNVTPPGELPQWQHFLFYASGSKSSVLLSKGSVFKINVHLNSNDLPSISDADGDGDLDLFVSKFSSGATIEFHKNYSVERYGTLDSLDFERITQTWAGVTECDCGVFAFNNNPCPVGGRSNHAGGKSLFAIDIDSDGDQDMLFSEEGHADEGGCSQLFLLENEGDNTTPIINQAIAYPPSSPASMTSFPAVTYEDVDFDGEKDLIVSPNISGRQFYQTDFKQSVWVYKNNGTTALPAFTTPNTDFLQENMIDVGDNAVPAFFDADGDGDLDLFIGYYSQSFQGSIQYFQNTGTPYAPAFKRITTDFLGLSYLNTVNFKPAFADMNSDGKIDLAFTSSDYAGLTQLYYLPNQNYIGANFLQTPIATGFFISSSENVSIIDVNFDGKRDLLVGRSNGSLAYWKNTSSSSTPQYFLESSTYLGFSSDVFRKNISCAADDLDGDGKPDLVITYSNGTAKIISDFRNATDGSAAITDIVYNPLQEIFKAQNLGGHLWPAIANIYKSNVPSLVFGNTLGGIHILKQEESVLEKTPIIDIYPNPIAKGSTILTIQVDRPSVMVAVTALGQEMGTPVYLQAFENYSYNLHEFPKGVYFLYFVIDGKSQARRIVIY